jgi:molybdenum cofactor cytidylyltransferase
MKLQHAFEIVPGDVVAFIGAGGKTSALIALGYELAESGWRVLATTTTRITDDQLDLFPVAMRADSAPDDISAALNDDKFVFLYEGIRGTEVYGPEPAMVSRLIDVVDSDVILVEADFAGGLPLKAPHVGEPNIPPETTLVIPVASLAVLGQPLDSDHVYNAQAIIDRYGFPEGGRIKSPWVAQVIRDEALGLHGVPGKTRVIAFLNQASATGYNRGRARAIARMALRQARLNGVAIGSARGVEPVLEVRRAVGAVVLAAGMSTRMGESKVLLPWTDGKTIIEQIVETLLQSRVDHVVVVTGYMAREVKERLSPLGVTIAHNRSYKSGEMISSLKVGLAALPDHVAAAMVVLGDQPRLQPKVLYQVLSAHAESAGELIIPSFERRRGHPILIGRRYWPEIAALPKDGTLRDVIETHADHIRYVPVDTDSILRDVDTPADYDEERFRAGLGRYSSRRSTG